MRGMTNGDDDGNNNDDDDGRKNHDGGKVCDKRHKGRTSKLTDIGAN